jgi:REP element-mobilizing transposase RayT
MPRTERASVRGICYHVLNRGNARKDVFHKDQAPSIPRINVSIISNA